MREYLVETSSIFNKDKNKGNSSTEKETLDPEVTATEPEEEALKYCKSLKFEHGEGNIILDTFFPDSFFCVIYDKHSKKFFAGNMKQESIYEVPFKDFNTLAVAENSVILEIDAVNSQGHSSLKYLVLHSNDYTLEDSKNFEEYEDHIKYKGKKYSLLTTELKEPKISSDGLRQTYFYKEATFVVEESKALYYEGEDSSHKLLLSDQTGCYLGYYLPINLDGTINLHGRRFEMEQRLTLPLAIALDIETGNSFILTCSNQMLVNLKSFGISNYKQISILNGIALLTDEESKGTTLHIFTPNHQKIILEKGYKVCDQTFGNGLYFEKDYVLLLDNGSLTFVEPVDRDTLRVKGREVEIPISYLGELV